MVFLLQPNTYRHTRAPSSAFRHKIARIQAFTIHLNAVWLHTNWWVDAKTFSGFFLFHYSISISLWSPKIEPKCEWKKKEFDEMMFLLTIPNEWYLMNMSIAQWTVVVWQHHRSCLYEPYIHASFAYNDLLEGNRFNSNRFRTQICSLKWK